jgi:hypothetical protein
MGPDKCGWCGHVLTFDEKNYYGSFCESCEGHADAIQDGKNITYLDRYWFYRRYLRCEPVTSAFMAIIGILRSQP